MKRSAAASVMILTLLCGMAAGGADTRPARIGYAQSIFKGRNQTDVIAAMKVWAETIAKEHGTLLDTRMVVFGTPDTAVAAVREKQVEGLTLSLSEYAAFPPGLLGRPFIRNEANGSTHVRYALVATANGRVRKVGDLLKARVVIHDGEQADIGQMWLDAQLAAAGLGRLRDVAARVTLNEKPSGTVLNVFFGSADACLVEQSMFESAVALNAQVGTRMAIVATSDPIIPSVLAFRADLSEEATGPLLHEILSIHETKTGAQVLQMFKADRMTAVTAEAVDQSVRLLNEWRRAADGPK